MAGPLPPRSDLASSGGPFEGFLDADFRAYEEKKWRSNAYTLERRRAKDKLIALARAIQERVPEPLSGLELHASEEQPSVANDRRVEAQLVYFVRGAQDQQRIRALLATTSLSAGAALFDIALNHQHAAVEVRLDLGGLSVGVRIATKAKVDRDNITEKLKQSWARERLVELAKTLPEGAVLGLEASPRAAAELTGADVEAMLPGFAQGGVLSAQVRLPSSDATLKTAAAIEQVAAALSSVAPIYRFLAWSHDNEHAHVKETLKKTSEERQKKAIPFAKGDRITILTGLFSGRQGYLEDIDAKGRAKVMVGPISVTVELKDLGAA